MEKNKTPKQYFFSECLLCLGVLCVSCCSKCLILNGPFCHGALDGVKTHVLIYTKMSQVSIQWDGNETHNMKHTKQNARNKH